MMKIITERLYRWKERNRNKIAVIILDLDGYSYILIYFFSVCIVTSPRMDIAIEVRE